MTIDLEQFVDKKVHLTLRNGEKHVTTINKQNFGNITYPYYFVHTSGSSISYTQAGNHVLNTSSQRDIIEIKLHDTKPMNSTELPESTIEKLAEVLSPDAIEYITGTEEYITFMTEMLTKFVRERVGNLNPEVECEIVSNMLSSNIDLRVVK